jgi:hypothetical protein
VRTGGYTVNAATARRYWAYLGTLTWVLVAAALASGLVATLYALQRPRTEVSSEAYAVYSVVLTQEYGSWFKGKSAVTIVPHTVLEPQGHAGYEACRNQLGKDETWRSLFDEMASEKDEFRIEARLSLPGKYMMQTSAKNDGSVLFFVSVVEFSADGSKAMVLVGHHCGALCGDGLVRELVKNNGAWRMTKDNPTAVGLTKKS